jgi:antitoxin YefM
VDTSYSELRQNLKKMIDWSADHHEPTFITFHKERKAVLMSYDDYCALEETAYLLRSPANAKRLLQAFVDSQNGKNISEHGLMDE